MIARAEARDERGSRDGQDGSAALEARTVLPSAILDALPTHVALVDGRGVIVTVNESWRRFGAANGAAPGVGGVGDDYLAVCDAAEGEGADDARRVADGIRAILSGSRTEFALEYPCHGPHEARWFRVLVTPLGEVDREGAVVMHLDVTAQHQAEERLRARETLLSNAQRIAHMGSWELDVQANRLTWSPETFDLFGVRPEAFASTYEAFYACLLPEDREAMDIAQVRADDDGVLEVEYRIRRPDGEIRWMYERGQVVFDDQGRQVKRLGVVMDVTERHALDEALGRNEALLRVASEISRLEVGRGTRIKVYLPAQTTTAEVDGVAAERTPYPQGQGETVLVVDDEELIRRVVSRTLERSGYRVLVAANGAEGVALFAQHRARVAVVLTDIAMPVMDGPTMIVALRSIDPDVRIVASSGLQANSTLSKATGAGIHHFVPKPYSAEALLTTLRAAILRP